MLVSYKWLNEYFDGKLPAPKDLAEALTMHSFEIESVEEKDGDSLIDVKVLPNRAHDCLSHRGIAREIGTILDIVPAFPTRAYGGRLEPASIDLSIGTELCNRCIFSLVRGVKVGPSPSWLREKLELLGQRSINNIVDVTNYAMLETGQPMHAFDLDKLVRKDGRWKVGLKAVSEETPITLLGGKEARLPAGTLVFTDDNMDGYNILDIAGMKGGELAEIDDSTENIALTAANFNQAYIRRFSKAVGVQTDATKRNENGITPELVRDGNDVAVTLIVEVAGTASTAVEAAVEFRSQQPAAYRLGVSASEVNRLLGTSLALAEIEPIMRRFGWDVEIVEPRSKIVELARQHVGKPYALGASVSKEAPHRFDCSSLACWLCMQAGIAIPRISIDQYAWSATVSEAEALPGDLIFANTGEGSIRYETVEYMPGKKVPEGVDHVGVYMGDGMVVHATRHKGGVVEEKLSESGQFKNIVGFGRAVRDEGKRCVMRVPDERLDLRRKEDLVEEIGRIYGYDKIPTTLPGPADRKPAVNKGLHYAERVREALIGLGFSEVYTYAFRKAGDVELANPIASDKAFLRSDLAAGMKTALDFNARYADLLGLDEIKIFEIGKVFSGDSERTMLCVGVRNVKKDKVTADAKAGGVLDRLPGAPKGEVADGIVEIDLDALVSDMPDPGALELGEKKAAVRYASLSPYPFVLRDVAIWAPEGTAANAVLSVITAASGDLLVKTRLFDTFTKEVDGTRKTSYAFRLVFQSHEKTLTDEEVNALMSGVTESLNSNAGWQVR